MTELSSFLLIALLVVFCTSLEIILRKPKPTAKIDFHAEDEECLVKVSIEAATAVDAMGMFSLTRSQLVKMSITSNPSEPPSVH